MLSDSGDWSQGDKQALQKAIDPLRKPPRADPIGAALFSPEIRSLLCNNKGDVHRS